VAAAENAARQREALGAAVCVASPALSQAAATAVVTAALPTVAAKPELATATDQAVSATGSSTGASALSGMPST
jgi:hypothetical protein